MASLNKKLTDSYIERDIALRRVAVGVTKQLDFKIIELGNELAALAMRIDPMSPVSEVERVKRRKALTDEGAALISKRMAEMKEFLTQQLNKIGVYEAAFVNKLLEEALNGL